VKAPARGNGPTRRRSQVSRSLARWERAG
jgi:hypothetical protein